MEYTQGPWEITGKTVYLNQIGFGKPKDPIGCVYGDPDYIETKSNARLCAAAPEMYEALRNILKNGNFGGKDFDHAKKVIAKLEEKNDFPPTTPDNRGHRDEGRCPPSSIAPPRPPGMEG